jgi:hypothetical protein
LLWLRLRCCSPWSRSRRSLDWNRGRRGNRGGRSRANKPRLRSEPQLLEDVIQLSPHSVLLPVGATQKGRGLKTDIGVERSLFRGRFGLEDSNVPIVPRARRWPQPPQDDAATFAGHLVGQLTQMRLKHAEHLLRVWGRNRLCHLKSHYSPLPSTLSEFLRIGPKEEQRS